MKDTKQHSKYYCILNTLTGNSQVSTSLLMACARYAKGCVLIHFHAHVGSGEPVPVLAGSWLASLSCLRTRGV